MVDMSNSSYNLGCLQKGLQKWYSYKSFWIFSMKSMNNSWNMVFGPFLMTKYATETTGPVVILTLLRLAKKRVRENSI